MLMHASLLLLSSLMLLPVVLPVCQAKNLEVEPSQREQRVASQQTMSKMGYGNSSDTAEEKSQPHMDRAPIDQEWFFQNSGVPEILKNILQSNAQEETIQNSAYDLHVGCLTYHHSELADFINSKVSPLFQTKPRFCEVFSERSTKTASISNHETHIADDGEVIVTPTASTTREIVQWSLKSEKLHPEAFSDPIDRYVVDALVKTLENQQQEESNSGEKSIDAKNIVSLISPKKGPPRELVASGLLRVWSSLSSSEQMKLLANCPPALDLNSHRGFWRLNSSEEVGNSDHYQLGLKLCQAKELKDITGLIDKSLLSEFLLNLTAKDDLDPIEMALLCEAWPQANLINTSPFPPIVDQDELYFNIGEYHRRGSPENNGQLAPFNPKELSKLTKEQRDALLSYTTANFDSMNAYEMWGSLGLFFHHRDMKKQWADSSSPNYIGDGGRLPKWDEMTSEQQREFLRVRSVYITTQGQRTSDAVSYLGEALRGMDQYQGISFSAQRLAGHLFTNLKVGRTFTPSFFMSTSTNHETAVRFLGLNREEDLTERYLFVVKNKTGVPLSNHSPFTEEDEVLVHPDATFEVTAIEPFGRNGEVIDYVKVIYLQEK